MVLNCWNGQGLKWFTWKRKNKLGIDYILLKQMNKKNIIVILALVVTALGGIILGNLIAERANKGNALSGLFGSGNSKIDQMLSLINDQYVDTVDVDSITDEVMTNLVAQLDPHSVYIPAKDLENVNDELEGSFSGIGVQFNIQNDTVMIISVVSGGPF